MRFETRVLGAAVGIGLPLGTSLAGPAAAGDPIIRTQELTFRSQGHDLSCAVEAYADVDSDDISHWLVYYGTRLVDEDPRCLAATTSVSAHVTYKSTDGTTDYYDSYNDDGTSTRSIARVSDPPEDVVVTHVAVFQCDDPQGCERSFSTHPYPYGSK